MTDAEWEKLKANLLKTAAYQKSFHFSGPYDRKHIDSAIEYCESLRAIVKDMEDDGR